MTRFAKRYAAIAYVIIPDCFLWPQKVNVESFSRPVLIWEFVAPRWSEFVGLQTF